MNVLYVFYTLCTELVEHGLKAINRTGVEEMVAMFLNMVGHGVDNKMIQERFQYSGETISRHFQKVLLACLRLSFKYIKPQDTRFHTILAEIQNDQ